MFNLQDPSLYTDPKKNSVGSSSKKGKRKRDDWCTSYVIYMYIRIHLDIYVFLDYTCKFGYICTFGLSIHLDYTFGYICTFGYISIYGVDLCGLSITYECSRCQKRSNVQV